MFICVHTYIYIYIYLYPLSYNQVIHKICGEFETYILYIMISFLNKSVFSTMKKIAQNKICFSLYESYLIILSIITIFCWDPVPTGSL